MYDFNADEIFEMAEQMERNGAKFYRDTAERTDSADEKELLLKLAAMEAEHEETFKVMRAQLSEDEKAPMVFDPSSQAVLYLRALADTCVFFKKEIDVTSIEEILKAAIETEKATIIFFLGIKEAVPENLGKNRVDAIIKEEMEHIRLLSTAILVKQKYL